MSDLSNNLFNELKNCIFKGDYPIGSKLPPERVLAEKYGVSRVTLRDALSKLSQMGLVRKIANSGTYITEYYDESSLDLLIDIMQHSRTIDSDTLLSLLEFRRLGEMFAVRKAVQNKNEHILGKLEDILKDGESKINEPLLLSIADYQFHYNIAKMSNNLVIQLIFNSFKPIYRYYTDFFYQLEGAAPKALENHQKLLNAINNNDEDYAAYIMEQTLLYGENRVKEALKLDGQNKNISFN